MISDLQFYSLPASIASGEYPLFSDSTDLTPYLIHTVKDVKISADLDQDRTVPTFEGYETASMVKTSAGWYWVVGVRTSTMYNDSIVVAMHYCASTSMIKSGDSIKGIWSRRPIFDPTQHQLMSQADMIKSRSVKVPKLSGNLYNAETKESDPNSTDLYWVQITSSVLIEQNTGEETQVLHTGNMTVYGMFATLDTVGLTSNKYLLWYDGYKEGNRFLNSYPSIQQIINDPYGFIGLEASTILDISIIPVCPYNYEEKTWNFYHASITTPIEASGVRYNLLNEDGNDVYPDVGKTVNGVVYRVYNLGTGGDKAIWFRGYPIARTDVVTLSSISTMERLNSSIQIKNWEGNVIGSFPIISDKLTCNLSYICDSSGIYTVIRNIESDQHIIIPSCKLPWVGTSWDAYKAYSMDTDRKAIEFAQSQYNKQFEIDMTNAVFNGILGAGLGAASGGPLGAGLSLASGIGGLATGAISGSLGRDLNNMKLKQDLELTEMRARSAPSTGYNTSYGLNQVMLMKRFGASIDLISPYNLTTDKFNGIVEQFGYPTEGAQTLSINGGYYKGRVLAQQNNKVFSGIKFERLQEEFNNGLKFVII